MPPWIRGGLSLQPTARLPFLGALWPALYSLKGLFDEVPLGHVESELFDSSGVPEEKKRRERKEMRTYFSCRPETKKVGPEKPVDNCLLRAVSYVSNEEECGGKAKSILSVDSRIVCPCSKGHFWSWVFGALDGNSLNAVVGELKKERER